MASALSLPSAHLPRTRRRPGAVVALALLALLAAAGCGDDDNPVAPPPGPARYTVEVAGSQRFTLRLDDAERIAAAERHLASGREGVIAGALARGDGGFNAPYGWHLVPATVEFPDLAIEVCDGLPQDVERDLDYWLTTVRQYCPWSARLVARVQ